MDTFIESKRIRVSSQKSGRSCNDELLASGLRLLLGFSVLVFMACSGQLHASQLPTNPHIPMRNASDTISVADSLSMLGISEAFDGDTGGVLAQGLTADGLADIQNFPVQEGDPVPEVKSRELVFIGLVVWCCAYAVKNVRKHLFKATGKRSCVPEDLAAMEEVAMIESLADLGGLQAPVPHS